MSIRNDHMRKHKAHGNFQRRHMEAIADTISEVGRYWGRDERWNAMKVAMSNMLAADNPRFNPGKFEEACEP